MDKVGAIFSVLALLMGSLFFFILLPSTDVSIDQNTNIAETRIITLDGFLSDLDGYYGEALKVSSRASLNSMTEYIVDRGYETRSKTICILDDLASQGYHLNYTFNEQGDDAAFKINPGVVATDLVAGNIYANFPITAEFKARNTSVLESAEVTIWGFGIAPYSVEAYLFDDNCGSPGRQLDYGIVNFNSQNLVSEVLLINFSKGYKVNHGETYHIMFKDTRLDAGADVVFFATNNLDSFPDSNTSLVSNINNYKYLELEDFAINNFTDKVVKFAKDELSLDLKVQVNDVDITQNQPWDVNVKLNITYFLDDSVVSWEKTSVIETIVSIEGLNDPYFSILNQNRTISKNDSFLGVWDLKTPKSNFTQGNFTLFETFYNQTFYLPSSRAPGYLMRFWNDTNSSSCCGIETLVNLSYPSEDNLSYVGFKYGSGEFYNCELARLWNLSKDPNDIFKHFKLDRDSVAYYGYGSGFNIGFGATFEEFIC